VGPRTTDVSSASGLTPSAGAPSPDSYPVSHRGCRLPICSPIGSVPPGSPRTQADWMAARVVRGDRFACRWHGSGRLRPECPLRARAPIRRHAIHPGAWDQHSMPPATDREGVGPPVGRVASPSHRRLANRQGSPLAAEYGFSRHYQRVKMFLAGARPRSPPSRPRLTTTRWAVCIAASKSSQMRRRKSIGR
jgi:hypothetical protein